MSSIIFTTPFSDVWLTITIIELVRRGELLFDPDFLSGWEEELNRMNEKKEGAKYRYPNSLMNMLAAIHAYLLPYKQIEGFPRVFGEHVDIFKRRRPTDYTAVWWRVAKVKVDIDPGVDIAKDVVIAVDSTGIKVLNREEWIREKWYGTKRKGFIKFHIPANVKTGKILSIDVTKENISDGARAISLVQSASKRVNIITRSLMDGAYDRRSIFNYLSNKGIKQVISVRKNSSSKARGSTARKLVVIEQRADYEKWKRKHDYCKRWRVESSI